jgi:hypothetical protein
MTLGAAETGAARNSAGRKAMSFMHVPFAAPAERARSK